MRARVAFDENLTQYKQRLAALFWFNALLIASNVNGNKVHLSTDESGLVSSRE